MKRCLVTGATGFIGSNLVRKLVEEEYEVYALIRPNSDSGMYRLKDINKVKYIISEPKDILKKIELPQLDVCFNLAAYGVKYSNQNIDDMIDANIKYLMDIIDFVNENSTKLLIHTGSCFEYGANYEKEKISEDDKLNPKSLYGVTKSSATIIGNIYAKQKSINMITVRPFGVFGPGEAEYRLVPQLINAALNNKKMDMTYGEQIRDYLYIDDLIDAYIKLSNSKEIEIYDIYNICSGKSIAIRKFVDIICDITQCNRDNYRLGKLKYRENEVMKFVGDNEKITKTIDWIPKVSIKDGMKLNIEWYKKNINS